ncbi:unnamed protein product [Rangifer tarandus platyrhynchus]|uniref:Uncharacterized protein n=1 Tax=Rangifer tarandus platyrhynchus TaxID=3082113 RepID=A0AC59YB62_RANTA
MSSTLLRSGRVDVRKLCNQSSLVRGVPPSPTTCSEPSAEPSEMSRAEGTARSSSGQSPVREEERDQAGAHQQYASTIQFWGGEGPLFIDGHLLTVSPHGGERGLVLFLLK